MQQTQTYKLNLIETSDTFSPAPLNENMEKLEDAISASAADLDSRVTVLEGHKIAAGIYTGNGSGWMSVPLGFTPIAVIAQPPGNVSYMVTTGGKCNDLQLETGGFKVYEYLNNQNHVYHFLAIL